MNTYVKFAANCFVAKCEERHEKGDEIEMTTRHGGTHEVIVFNFLGKRDGHFLYSVVRSDGFNVQEWARRRAERLNSYAENALDRGKKHLQNSDKDRDFLSLGEPIKIGHHSEKKHRRIIEDAQRNFSKYMAENQKAEGYIQRAEYYESLTDRINLSMPESIEYYAYRLKNAQRKHQHYKDNPGQRPHSMSLQYALRDVKEAEKNYNLALMLWGTNPDYNGQ